MGLLQEIKWKHMARVGLKKFLQRFKDLVSLSVYQYISSRDSALGAVVKETLM